MGAGSEGGPCPRFTSPTATATAEWYRSLAEWGLSPQDHIPYDHHRWRLDLELADLSDNEQLRRIALETTTAPEHMACLSACR
jgi:hypothetical protein